MLRVVFWGNARSVFSSRHFGALLNAKATIVAVIDAPPGAFATSNPLPVDELDFVREAVEIGIPVFQPESPNRGGFLTILESLKTDLFLAAGYPLILEPPILAVPDRLAVNFHASLLPKYRGKHPVFWTLRGDEIWAGLTVHVMDPGIDTGDILYQVKVRTRRDDTVSSLYSRILDRSVGLVNRLIEDMGSGTLSSHKQPENGGSYFSSIKEQDFALCWDWPAEKLRRYILMTPGECFALIMGQEVFFLNAGIFRLDENLDPGELAWLGRTRAGIATGDGGLWCSRVQANGQNLSLASFCRNLGLVPGSSLG